MDESRRKFLGKTTKTIGAVLGIGIVGGTGFFLGQKCTSPKPDEVVGTSAKSKGNCGNMQDCTGGKGNCGSMQDCTGGKGNCGSMQDCAGGKGNCGGMQDCTGAKGNCGNMQDCTGTK